LGGDNNIDSLKPFFEPRSVAIIGTSRTPGKGGYNIIENLLRLKFEGGIYPINPRAKEILGLKVYSSLAETPEVPELVLIVLPPDRVLASFRTCIGRSIKAVIIESAGFGEMDAPGAVMQEQISQMARRHGVRVMGPNSVGTINPYHNFDASLGRLDVTFLPDDDMKPGPVGLIGQTGLFTGVYLPLINAEFGTSKIACLGNKCDVDESDMLAYLGADPATRFIGMYLESIKDGHRFLEISRSIIPEKPIVVIKSAITENGAGVSVSHTGSIAGEDRVYDAAFRQAGISRVGSFEQLWDVIRAFVHLPLPVGNRVGIINLSGSGCVTSVDACARNGLEIARLSLATRDAIRTVYPDWWQVRSPVDVWTAIEASGFESTFTTVTRALLADNGVDAVIVITGAIDWMPGKEVATLLADLKNQYPGKPLMAVTPLGDRGIYLKMHREFLARGIPNYANDADAISSLAILYRYQEFRKNLAST
jgi:acyl-CoA synthetase (NDP forming)